MTEGTAIEIARCKMHELGVGNNYIIRYRHLRLDPNEKRTLKAENHIYFLLHSPDFLKVESKAGIYNMLDVAVNEQQHVHTGIIKIENQSAVIEDAKFIQVIPIQIRKQTK